MDTNTHEYWKFVSIRGSTPPHYLFATYMIYLIEL